MLACVSKSKLSPINHLWYRVLFHSKAYVETQRKQTFYRAIFLDFDYHFCFNLIKLAFGPCAHGQSASIVKPWFTRNKVNKSVSEYRFQSVVDCVVRELGLRGYFLFHLKENSKFLPRNKFITCFRDICLSRISNVCFCTEASLPLLMSWKTRETDTAVLSYHLSRFNWRNQKRNETRVVIKLCYGFVDQQVFPSSWFLLLSDCLDKSRRYRQERGKPSTVRNTFVK